MESNGVRLPTAAVCLPAILYHASAAQATWVYTLELQTKDTLSSVAQQPTLASLASTHAQEGLITFSPPLPDAKCAAMSRVKMGSVVKVMLTFHEQFWPEGMYDVVRVRLCDSAWFLLDRSKVLHALYRA